MFGLPWGQKGPNIEQERERLQEQARVTIEGQKRLDKAIEDLLAETLKRKASDG